MFDFWGAAVEASLEGDGDSAVGLHVGVGDGVVVEILREGWLWGFGGGDWILFEDFIVGW